MATLTVFNQQTGKSIPLPWRDGAALPAINEMIYDAISRKVWRVLEVWHTPSSGDAGTVVVIESPTIPPSKR